MSDRIWELHMQGFPVPAIAELTGESRHRVRKEIAWRWAQDKEKARARR